MKYTVILTFDLEGAEPEDYSTQCGQGVEIIFKNQKLIYLIPSYLLL
jgi:hypothetical protein